ncbi:AraC family transcriptional regulator [Burkholderia gladioli]|uniref:AraC family transcriptional regulator n=1 Tax=Burkholderia gladioli TaxID=28095 RepID=UPI0034DB4412
MERYLSELREGLLRHAQGRRTDTAIARVSLSRGQATTGPLAGLYEPMLCLVVQGAKRVIVGDRVLDYDPGNCFVTAVEVPATGRIVEASRQRPYLAIGLVFEPAIVTELLAHLPQVRDGDAGASFAVEPVSAALLDAWVRMIRLLDHPAEIPALAPLIEREILFRLLQGPHARVLRQIARADGRLYRIRRAVARIRTRYDQPLRIEELAELAGMSLATFHRHFKAVTTLAPLQYQKIVRLQQARRLLMIENRAVTEAAFAVGYESASQFSREYARQFGASPAQDVARLRSAAAVFDEAAAGP